MKTPVAPISLAGSELGITRHVCAFFHSSEEEYRVLLPFIKDGFECGDKAVHVVDPEQHHNHLERLAAAGIDAAAAQHRGNSSFAPTPKRIFVTAASIRNECWSFSSSWLAAMRAADFHSVASFATWNG